MKLLSLLTKAILKHVVSRDSIFKNSANKPILYPKEINGIVSCLIFHVILHYFLERNIQHLGHIHIALGSVGQVGQQV